MKIEEREIRPLKKEKREIENGIGGNHQGGQT